MSGKNPACPSAPHEAQNKAVILIQALAILSYLPHAF
jgi:hypothetical protein